VRDQRGGGLVSDELGRVRLIESHQHVERPERLRLGDRSPGLARRPVTARLGEPIEGLANRGLVVEVDRIVDPEHVEDRAPAIKRRLVDGAEARHVVAVVVGIELHGPSEPTRSASRAAGGLALA